MIKPIQNTNVNFKGAGSIKKGIRRATLLAKESATPVNIFKAMPKEDQQRIANGILAMCPEFPTLKISDKKDVIRGLMSYTNGTTSLNSKYNQNGLKVQKGFKDAVCEAFSEKLEEAAEFFKRGTRECDKQELKAIKNLIKKDDAGKTTVGDIAKYISK